MSLTFAQRTGLRLCALAVTALMIAGMLHPRHVDAQAGDHSPALVQIFLN